MSKLDKKNMVNIVFYNISLRKVITSECNFYQERNFVSLSPLDRTKARRESIYTENPNNKMPPLRYPNTLDLGTTYMYTESLYMFVSIFPISSSSFV